MADQLEIIGKLQLGLTTAEVAKLTGESLRTVERVMADAINRKVLADHRPTTHAEVAARRKLISSFVKERGGTKAAIAEAAQKFSVTIKRVRQFCSEVGIKIEGATRDPGARKAPQLVILAAIIADPEAGDRELAEKLQITKQYVNVVRKLANQAGVFLEIERAKERAVREAMGAGGASGGKAKSPGAARRALPKSATKRKKK